MEAYKDCLVRAISKDGLVNAVAVYTRGLTERARQIHHTSPVATAALGRALAACSMMGNALKDNGGKRMDRLVYYFSSTEKDEKEAYTTHTGIEPPYVIEIPKYNKFLVRAVRKF